MQIGFPNKNQVGGRVLPLLALATANQKTFGRAISHAVNLVEFHGLSRSALGTIPSSFGPEVKLFMRRACDVLQKPMIQSFTALSDYPAPSRLKAEAVNDDMILDCIKHQLVPESYAMTLIGAASAFESMMKKPLGDEYLTLHQRTDLAMKLWDGSIGSKERDQAGVLLLGYEVPNPKWQGAATDSGEIKRARFLRGLRSAVETDMLSEAIINIGRRKPITSNIKPPMLQAMHSKGVITSKTYDTLNEAIRQQREGNTETPTVRIKHPSLTGQAELGLIPRMDLAMKVWIGVSQYPYREREQAEDMLSEYKLPPLSQIDELAQTNRIKRMYFLDMFRGALETNILREVVGDMGVLQFMEPKMIRTMLDMGMVTSRTYYSICNAIKRMDPDVHERSTAECPTIPR